MTAQSNASGREENAPLDGERDIRPIVRKPSRGLSNVAIALLIGVAAIALFLLLDSRRRARTAPSAIPQASTVAPANDLPPLYIPPQAPRSAPTVAPLPVTEPEPSPAPTPQPRIEPSEQSAPPQQAVPVEQPRNEPQRNLSAPALVVDRSAGGMTAPARSPERDEQQDKATRAGGNEELMDTKRARSGLFAGPSRTVSQGTIIPAVLETGLDSNHAGFARALVQHDIRGFDGTRTLIPRGSRLIGQYSGAVAQGQKRAYIVWTRLIRPDGVTITLNSPAADTVGKAGVKADVDSHFFSRFAGAILQSVLDVGVNLASRSTNSPVIVALPGATQSAAQTVVPATQIEPTLKVKPGTSISVFAARDLEFDDPPR